jgi:hypothetical protein
MHFLSSLKFYFLRTIQHSHKQLVIIIKIYKHLTKKAVACLIIICSLGDKNYQEVIKAHLGFRNNHLAACLNITIELKIQKMKFNSEKCSPAVFCGYRVIEILPEPRQDYHPGKQSRNQKILDKLHI